LAYLLFVFAAAGEKLNYVIKANKNIVSTLSKFKSESARRRRVVASGKLQKQTHGQ